MTAINKSPYESHQAGYLSADIFFYGDEKPTLLHEMPFVGTIGTTETVFRSPRTDNDGLEATLLYAHVDNKNDRRAFKIVFSDPLASGVEYPTKAPRPSYKNYFSH